ncbi:uncharacterized protein EKO05_0004563 [Ascochyta rabiei]|uniref:uncharacterized protein n=1 Tax=Didymella rabiei TaxID=5454 RepID=UPI0018FF4540|nr:uncharacterized protein EKO05_0004563 [Ascochyta rabiei]UPX14071.1 hypothetical protein EKO05_0004563 [Ascochyta rabiei]
MDPREVAIQSAIADLNSGVFTSQRQAAKAYGVPRSTIQERLSGRQPNAIAHHQQQRLTPEQEQFLVNWILEEDSRAQPPSHPRVREMATLILHMNGDYEPLGHKWVTHFITRNPRVASIVGRKIESARTTAANYETIRAFLELFERTRIELGIQYEDIWNMDETGVGLGVCSNSRVVASSSKKKAYVKSPEDREWVSIIESISAVGKKLQCLVIFKGKHLQSTWFPAQGVPDWLYTTSENGWTSNAIGSEWLKRIFLPQTTPQPGRWRLLILDGHGSQIPIDFMWLCKQSKVYLLYLPPHASHVLQPLDLAPFSVLKSRYRSGIRALSALDDAAPIKKERFVTSYNKARDEGLSERVIRAGWKAAGLCPYNPDLVLLSSQVSGRPITPPPSTQASDDVFATPQSSQALYKAQQLILSESHSRSTRLMLGKAGKAIARANTRAARLEFENQRLKYQLDSATITHSRKRVQVNPNERYSNVEAIKAAIDRAAALQAEQASRQGEDEAKKAAAAAAALTLQSMCTEWQL